MSITLSPFVSRHPEMPARSTGLEGCCSGRLDRRPSKLALLAPQGDGLTISRVYGSLRKFAAHFIGVLAHRRHRSVAARVGIMPRRRRIAHRPAGRADRDAAQMRMLRQVRWRVDAGKGDVRGGELLLEQRRIEQ